MRRYKKRYTLLFSFNQKKKKKLLKRKNLRYDHFLAFNWQKHCFEKMEPIKMPALIFQRKKVKGWKGKI